MLIRLMLICHIYCRALLMLRVDARYTALAPLLMLRALLLRQSRYDDDICQARHYCHDMLLPTCLLLDHR